MCDHLNEQDGVHFFLIARVAQLEEEIEEWKLKWIEATNPGIDIDQIKIGRAAFKRALEIGEELK